MRFIISLFSLLIFSPLISQENFYLNPIEKQRFISECKENKQSGISRKTVWRHQEYNGIISMAKYKSEIINYDSLGRIIEWENYNVGNILETITRYNYDENFTPVSEVEYLGTGQVLYRTEFLYHKDYMAEQKFYYGKDNLRVVISYTHDSLKNETAEYKYYPLDKLRSIKRYVYKDHLLVNEYNLKGDSSLMYVVEYSYDKHGNQIKELMKSPKGVIIASISKEYNNKNQKTKETKTDYEGNVEYVHMLSYSSDGELIGFEEKNGNGSTTMLLRYTYDYF